jgi:hypothetical protein
VAEVFEMLALAVVAALVLAAFGALWSLAALVCWLIFLPFRLLAFVFKGFAVLLALPILLLVGGVLALVLGVPVLLALAFTVGPIVLLFVGIVWVARRMVRGVSSHAT